MLVVLKGRLTCTMTSLWSRLLAASMDLTILLWPPLDLYLLVLRSLEAEGGRGEGVEGGGREGRERGGSRGREGGIGVNKQFFFFSLLFYSFMLVFLPIILLSTPQLFSKKRINFTKR